MTHQPQVATGEAPISTAAWIDSLTANGSAEAEDGPGMAS